MKLLYLMESLPAHIAKRGTVLLLKEKRKKNMEKYWGLRQGQKSL